MAAIIGAHALPVGRMMPGEGATGGVFEAERLAPVILTALRDAGIESKDVGSAIFTANPPSTPQFGFSVYMSSRLGLECTGTLTETMNLGISGSLAFDQACAEVDLGRAKIAIVAGIQYQTAIKGHEGMEQGIRSTGDADYQAPFGFTPISWYGLDAARYMHETGLSRTDLTAVPVKSRQWSALNPLAQFKDLLTEQDVMESALIVDPLRLHDIPQRADGAICMVLAGDEAAKNIRADSIRVAARGFAHDGHHQMADEPHDITDFPAARDAVSAALEMARTKLNDLDLYEIYAPCSITEILAAEAIGLFGRGFAGPATREGRTAPSGDLPINTSGGCLARGHPPLLTGLYGLYELWEQLRGAAGARQVKGARRGLHISELGNYNASLAHILEAV